jgi:hypothetical protein
LASTSSSALAPTCAPAFGAPLELDVELIEQPCQLVQQRVHQPVRHQHVLLRHRLLLHPARCRPEREVGGGIAEQGEPLRQLRCVGRGHHRDAADVIEQRPDGNDQTVLGAGAGADLGDPRLLLRGDRHGALETLPQIRHRRGKAGARVNVRLTERDNPLHHLDEPATSRSHIILLD